VNSHVTATSPILYGESDFGSIRKQGKWYVDKTHFLPKVEASYKRLLFVRPPWFGKTLFLSMMGYYYDLNYKDDFDELFGGLWIHKNPTSLRSSSHVLHLNMAVPTDGDLHENLTKRVNIGVEDCCRRYGLDVQSVVEEKHASISMRNLARKFWGEKFMILVDDYDRFANQLLFDSHAYDKIIKRRSGDPTYLIFRSVLQTLDTISGCADLSEFRSFITGILPLASLDISGYVASNVSLRPAFGDIVGFSENDITDALTKYLNLTTEQQKHVIDVMRSYFDGYLFPGSKQSLYNSFHVFCID